MATIRDVARECGVSTATVSNVLNGRLENVNPETKDKVLAGVRKLRYKLPASGDRGGATRTQTIAVVSAIVGPNPVLGNGYFLGVLDGILEASSVRGWATTIMFQKVWDRSGSSVRRNYDGRCDGAILMAPYQDDELVSLLHDRGTPCVSIGSTFPELNVASVDIDNERAAIESVEYLWSLGHRKIAYVGPDALKVSSVQRATGYVEAMRGLGAREQDIQVIYSDFDSLRSFERAQASASEFNESEDKRWATDVVRKFMANPCQIPTALISWNSDLTRSVLLELQSLGLEVPKDISVITFDDLSHNLIGIPEITCQVQPLSEIGRSAVELLIKMIRDPDLSPITLKFKTQLVTRDSTAAPSIRGAVA